jgi:hypothetical protein
LNLTLQLKFKNGVFDVFAVFFSVISTLSHTSEYTADKVVMQVIKPMQTSKTANQSLLKFNVEIKIRLAVSTYDSRAVIFSFQVKNQNQR